MSQNVAPRLIRRREVLAFVALTTDEANAPKTVDFREYLHSGQEWHVIEVEVETEAAFRFWMTAFGHRDGSARVFERDTHTSYRSQEEDGWRGWTTIVSARVEKPTPPDGKPLDEATVTALTVLAAEEPAS